MQIGGCLNPTGEVSDLAQGVLNRSATIDTQGNMTIRSHALHNENAYFFTEMRRISEESRSEYLPNGEGNRYPEHETRWAYDDDVYYSVYLADGRKVRYWTQYIYQRTVDETTLTHSYPALIQAGQNIQFSGNVINDKSQILAGHTIANAESLPFNPDMQGAIGQRIVRDQGQYQTTELKWRNGWNKFLGLDKRRHYYNHPYHHEETHEFSLPITATHGVAPRALPEAPPGTLVAPIEPGALQLRSLPVFDWLPTRGTFQFQTDPHHPYLVEVDPQFLQAPSPHIPRPLSSDYLLRDKLQLVTLPKRLGSGGYEQLQVREQIRALTQQRYLSGYTSDETTFRGLMDAAHAQQVALALQPGTALSQDQVNQLEHDIIWMVNQEVTLPNGQKHTVLAPQVYLALTTKLEPLAVGALISAKRIEFKAQNLNNSGSTLLSQESIHIEADEIKNQRGQIASRGDLQLKAEQNLDCTAGQLRGDNMTLEAGKDIQLNSLTKTTESANGHQTVLSGQAVLQAGSLQLKAGRDVTLKAAQLDVEEKAHIQARAQIKLGGTEISRTDKLHNFHYQMTNEQRGDIGSEVNARGGLRLEATDIEVIGSQLSTEGVLEVEAECNVEFKTGQHQATLKSVHHQVDDGLLGSKTQDTHQNSRAQMALSSSLTGAKVQLKAGGDLKGNGLQIEGKDLVQIDTGGQLRLEAAANTMESQHSESVKKSGLITDGGLSLGKKSQKVQQIQRQSFHTGSKIHTQGDLKLNAGQDLYLEGSNLQAVETMQLTGSTVEVKEVMNTQEDTTQAEQHKSGLSIGAGGGVAAIGGQVRQNIQAADQARSNSLAAIKNLQAMHTIGSVVSSNTGRNQGVSHKDLVTSLAKGRPTEALKASGLGAQVSFSTQDQYQTSHQKSSQAQSSYLQAGQLQIHARDKDLKLSGTKLKGKTIDLEAAGDIEIRQATNTVQASQNSRYRDQKVGLRMGVTGQKGLSYEGVKGSQHWAQSNTTGQQSEVTAEQILRIRSGGDTRLEGVKASGKQVTAQVAGELTLRSTQDTMYEAARSSEARVGISAPIGVTGIGDLTVNIGYQQQQVTAEAHSVTAITTLQAGRDGFAIEVGKGTKLIGASILSEAPYDQNQLISDTVQFEQLENKASYQESQQGAQLNSGLGVGGNLVNGVTSNLGLMVNRPQVKSGTTEAFLSGAQLKLKSGQVPPPVSSKPMHCPVDAFDTTEMAEQSMLGEAVSQLGMQVSGDITGLVSRKAPTWEGVETLRTALHAGVAGVSAAMSGQSVGGAVAGVVAGDAATKHLGSAKNVSELGKAISNLAQNAIAGAAGLVAGAMVDGGAGAFSGASQAMMVDTWNRQLHEDESVELEELMEGKSPEEEQEWQEAAVATTKGDEGVSDKDPQAQSVEMATRGQEHTEKLEKLRETGLFKTTVLDEISDFTLQNEEVIQQVWGAVEAAAGIAAGTTIAAGSAEILNPRDVLRAVLAANTVPEGAEALGPYQLTEEQQDRLKELGIEILTSLLPFKGMLKLAGKLRLPKMLFNKLPTLFQVRKIRGFTPAQLIAAGNVIDPSDKLGKLSRAGRSLRKHGSREGTVFPLPKGTPAEVNRQAQEIMKQIINHPHRKVTSYLHGRHGKIIHVQTPDGKGIRYRADGRFIGFMGPRRRG